MYKANGRGGKAIKAIEKPVTKAYTVYIHLAGCCAQFNSIVQKPVAIELLKFDK